MNWSGGRPGSFAGRCHGASRWLMSFRGPCHRAGHIACDVRRCERWSTLEAFGMAHGSQMTMRVPEHRTSLRIALVSGRASRPP